MEQQVKETVNRFLKAVKETDLQSLNLLVHPAIKWNQPGSNVLSGIKNTSEDVFGMVGKMFEISANTLQLTAVKSIASHGDQVACLLSWQARRPDGAKLVVDNIDVYTVKDGKIIGVVVYSTDVNAENLFWGSN